jgi:hypothetical protein
MSRHVVTVLGQAQTDREAVIGYDPPLWTFFLQAFPNPETDACTLWLDGIIHEFSSIEAIVEMARSRGFDIRGLGQDAIIAMTKEAGIQTPPSVGERLGIVR